MLTIKNIETPGYNKRSRLLSFEEIFEERFISAAAQKSLGIESGSQFIDLDDLLEQVSESEYESAKERAIRLLSMRDHSAFEVKQKLKSESFQEASIARVMDYLHDYGLIDDARMLSSLLERELVRGVGINKVKMKLKIKGFSDDEIDTAFNALELEDYDSIASEQAAKHLKRFDLNDRKSRDKAYRMLRNKGFTHEQTVRAIDN